MTAYIKLSTLEYPRHIGDIQIDRVGANDYASVEWTDRPEFDRVLQRCSEGAPVQINGVWKMTWVVRNATLDEIEKANNMVDPLAGLLL